MGTGKFRMLLLFLFLLLGCGSPETQKVVFSVGGAPKELAAWDDLLRDFEGISGIPVELLRQPADTDRQRQGLMISLKAGLPDPDVFLMDVSWLALFARSGWLEPLPEFDASPFFDEVVRKVDTYQGRLLALPVYMDGGLLFYRRDLLDRFGLRPPETLAELLSSSWKLQEEMRAQHPAFFGFVWQGAPYEGLICSFLEFTGKEGGFRLQDGKVLLNLPANRTALRFMRDLIWKYKISPPSTFTEMREEQARLFFQRGDALYERNWPYAWSLHQSPESKVRQKIGIAPFPGMNRNDSVSTLGGWHIGISRFSNVKREAREFVKYVVSERGQKKMVLRLGWNPGRQDLYRDPEVLAKMPHLRDLQPIFQRTRPRPVVPYYPQMSEIVQRRIHAVIANLASPEEALREAEKEIAALLGRYELNRP